MVPSFQVYTAVFASNVYFTLLRVASFEQAKVAVAVIVFESIGSVAVAAIALVVGLHVPSQTNATASTFKQVPSFEIVVPNLRSTHAFSAASYAALSVLLSVFLLNSALLVSAVLFYALASAIAFSFASF